jgi:hypothetical protein
VRHGLAIQDERARKLAKAHRLLLRTPLTSPARSSTTGERKDGDDGQNAVAIVIEFVNPAVASRHPVGYGRLAGRDEARRYAALRRGPAGGGTHQHRRVLAGWSGLLKCGGVAQAAPFNFTGLGGVGMPQASASEYRSWVLCSSVSRDQGRESKRRIPFRSIADHVRQVRFDIFLVLLRLIPAASGCNHVSAKGLCVESKTSSSRDRLNAARRSGCIRLR